MLQREALHSNVKSSNDSVPRLSNFSTQAGAEPFFARAQHATREVPVPLPASSQSAFVHIGGQIFKNISFFGAGVVQYTKEIQRFLLEAYREQRVDYVNVSGIFLLPPQCNNRFSSIRGTTLATSLKCGARDHQLSLSLYKANLSLLHHASN